MDLSMLFGQLCVKNKSSTSKKILQMKKKFQAALGLGEYATLCHQFLRLQSLEEMFALFWNCPAAHRFLVSPGAQPSKKEEASELLRVEGNQMYKQNNLEQALKCYNLSIILAPHPKLPLSNSCDNNQGSATGKEGRRESFEDKYKLLSCGYANRSAVFLSMKEYDKCLADIDLAFKYGYSKQLKDKLLSRRERCLKAKQEFGSKGENPVFWSLNAKIPPVLQARNPSVPSFSSSLKVVHSHMRGRHVVASRDIAPGEVLAVEKSYCSFIKFDDNMMRACPVCFMRCDQGVPCPDCMVIFCSEDCRDKGLEGAHGKECKILSYLTGLDIDDDEIVNALRIVVHTTFMELKEKLPVLMKESEDLPAEKLGFDGNNVYDSTDYRSVYHISAYNGRKPNNKVFNLCFTVFVLTKVLYESKAFFVDRSGNEIRPTKEDLIMTGTALLYHVGHDNRFFEVSDIKVIANSDETENQGIGCALFPSIWLIKHACNSNAAHYNMGQVRVVRSILSIPAGSEVTLMYSEGYFCLGLKYRKTLLKARGIDCSCEACENDWPTEDKLPDEVLFKCIKCSKPVVELELQPVCLNCNISYSKTMGNRHNTLIKKFWDIVGKIVEAEHRYDAVVLKMKKGQPVNKHDFADIRNFIVALEKHVSLPCRAILKTRKVLLNYFFVEK